MYTLSVENEKGDLLELTDNSNYDVLEVFGLNPPAAIINTVAISGLDGTRFNSSQVGERNIVITLNIRPPIEANRIALYKYFRVKRYIKVHYKNETLDVFTEGYIESFENNLFTRLQQPQISIICPDPFWKAIAETDIKFEDLTALFEFPFSIPAAGIPFSELIQVTTTYFNAGDIPTGAIIRFVALADGVKNPTFYNRSNSTFFGLDFTMQNGDIITLDTQQGEKSVKLTRAGTTTSLLSYKRAGSVWLTFEPGENEIAFDAEEGEGNLRVTLEGIQRFEGV